MTPRRVALALALTVWGISTALAAGRPPANRAIQQQQDTDELKSIDEILQRCRTHCAQTMTTVDDMAKAVKEGRASADLEHMRTALGRVEAPLTDIKGHMMGCVEMIDMVEERHQAMKAMKPTVEEHQ